LNKREDKNIMNCEIIGCGTPMSDFEPTAARTDGVLVEVLNTKRAYLVCNSCAKKLGLIR